MLTSGISLWHKAVPGIGAGAFSPTALFGASEAGAWYDPSDLSTLYQDAAGTTPVTTSGQPVGLMLDKSGNDYHQSQAITAARPTYVSDVSGKYLLFDGVDDYMNYTGMTDVPVPFDRLTALRQVSWVLGDFIYQSQSSSGLLYQNNATPALRINGGAINSGLAVGANGVVTERHGAAISQLAVNNGAYVNGSGAPNVAGLLSVGAATSGAAPSNIRLYGTVLRAGTMTDAEIASLRTWLGAKCGVSL